MPLTTDTTAMNTFCSAAVDESTLQSPHPQDNYAGCGGVPGDRFVLRYAGGELYEGPSRNYKLRFNLDVWNGTSLDGYSGNCTAQTPMCQTSYVRVYHPALDTWIVTPHYEATDSVNGTSPLAGAALAAFLVVPKRGRMVFHHYEPVPFRMIITRIQ